MSVRTVHAPFYGDRENDAVFDVQPNRRRKMERVRTRGHVWAGTRDKRGVKGQAQNRVYGQVRGLKPVASADHNDIAKDSVHNVYFRKEHTHAVALGVHGGSGHGAWDQGIPSRHAATLGSGKHVNYAPTPLTRPGLNGESQQSTGISTFATFLPSMKPVPLAPNYN
jgi:hypothetical protein